MTIRFEDLLTFMVLCLTHFLFVNCNSRWLTNLPDSRKINTLSFLGTHNSATYKVDHIPMAWTQNMSITKQLEAGVRVFDMRLRLIDDVYAMHHERVYLKLMFGHVMNAIKSFLASNPKEFIIMFIQEEWTRKNTTFNNECRILGDHYLSRYPNMFVEHWWVDDTIGQHRGKILLAKAHKGFDDCSTKLDCREQNNWSINSTYTKDNKWEDVTRLQDEIFSSNGQSQCYINYLSANGGVLFPPQSICCQFYPLEWLFSGLRKLPEMNSLMLDYFRNPKNTLYIVMADFPSTQLIDKIISSN